MNLLRRLQAGVTLNVLVQIPNTLGLGFASYLFFAQGLSLYQVMSIWAIGPLISVLLVAGLSRWYIKPYLLIGIIAYLGMLVSLAVTTPYSFVLYAVCYGVNLALFWVSLNYIFFANSTRTEHAQDSAVYFLIGPVLGIVLPPLGALILQAFGTIPLLVVAGGLYLPALAYIGWRSFPTVTVTSFRVAHTSFTGVRLVTFYDGALHFFQTHFLPTYILLFIVSEFGFASFISYLSLISLLVAVPIARLSDQATGRTKPLWLLLLPMSYGVSAVGTIVTVACGSDWRLSFARQSVTAN